MKRNSWYIGLLNIVFGIVLVITRYTEDSINCFTLYEVFSILQHILYLIVAVFNMFNVIYCLKNNEKKGAIFQGFIAVLIILINVSIYTSLHGYEIKFNSHLQSDEILEVIFTIILSIINFLHFSNKNLNEDENSRSKLFLIVTILMLFLLIITVVSPIILFKINLKRLEKVLPNLLQAECEWTYIQFDGEQYIFKNRKGKVLNTVPKSKSGEIFVFSPENYDVYWGVNIKMNSTDKLILLGYTNKGYVLNYKGEILFKLCCAFETKEKFGSSFMTCASVYLYNKPYSFSVTTEGCQK